MTKQVWLPADGALLKKLRIDAEVEITTLARTHSLSTTQVKQLEDGGDSGFYTSAIKLATGRKLLMHFGADVQPVESDPDKLQTPELEITAVIEPVETETTKNPPRLQIVGAVLIFLGLALSGVYLSTANSESRQEKSSQQSPPVTPIATPLVEPTTTVSSSAISAKAKTKTTDENSSECKWGDEPISVLGHQPTKPGDYVHVVANMDGVICVKDATSKLHVLHLKSVQSQTVRGRPPFEIFSLNLNDFKLFYQGNLLRLPTGGIKNITLKEQKYE
jgi:hypothetical protein